MDIAAGLALLGQATGIVKNLRDIDKGYDVAALKSQMADIYSTLADVRISLSDARETLHEKEKTIKELEQRIASLSSGELCPVCSEGRLKVTAVRPHHIFGDVGVQEKALKCEKCDHAETRMHDPVGRTKR